MKNTLKLGLVPGKFEGTCEWKKIEKKNGRKKWNNKLFLFLF